jgi:hypothetical protein
MTLKALGLSLLLVALAGPAQAYQWLNDALQTSGVTTDRVMIASGANATVPEAVSATQSSTMFTAKGERAGMFSLVVSACPTSCSVLLKIETLSPDGTSWVSWGTSVAIVATGTYDFGFGGFSNSVSTPGSDLEYLAARPIPEQFRGTVTWTSGTSITYMLYGATW